MVALSLQVVQFRPPQSLSLCGCRPRNFIKCRIAEPTGKPAPLGQKTKYEDGFFEKAFMTLFARKMEKFAAPAQAGTKSKKKAWFEHDYESFVDVSKRVMQGRNRMQQQQVVREVLLSMLPPGAPEQVTFLRLYQLVLFGLLMNRYIWKHRVCYPFIASNGSLFGPYYVRMILAMTNYCSDINV